MYALPISLMVFLCMPAGKALPASLRSSDGSSALSLTDDLSQKHQAWDVFSFPSTTTGFLGELKYACKLSTPEAKTSGLHQDPCQPVLQ